MNELTEYSIDCTGDCVVGDEVAFERATFTGSWRKPKFAGNETIYGRIAKDSYGRDKQQHTFTLELGRTFEHPPFQKLLIKGRNLYRNGVKRKPWADESKRDEARTEKHQRGDRARLQRDLRKAYAGFDWQTESLADYEQRHNLQPA